MIWFLIIGHAVILWEALFIYLQKGNYSEKWFEIQVALAIPVVFVNVVVFLVATIMTKINKPHEYNCIIINDSCWLFPTETNYLWALIWVYGIAAVVLGFLFLNKLIANLIGHKEK